MFWTSFLARNSPFIVSLISMMWIMFRLPLM